MKLFRRKSSGSTNTTSTSKIRKAINRYSAPVPQPPFPTSVTASTYSESYPDSQLGSSFKVISTPKESTTINGHSTSSSQLSNLTAPSDQATTRSTVTLPSSIDDVPTKNGLQNESRNSFPRKSVSTSRRSQVQPRQEQNGVGIYPPSRRSSNVSIDDERLDSRHSSMTITQRGAARDLQSQPLQAHINPRPQNSLEWKERDPSINTRYTHSPTPSESLSFQSVQHFPPANYRPSPRQHQQQPHQPQQPQPQQQQYTSSSPHPQHNHPNTRQFQAASSPAPTRTSTFRTQSRVLPSLPENSFVNNQSRHRHSMPQQRTPAIPATPGPRSAIISFTQNQIQCLTDHKSMHRMPNFHHSVPCMTCRKVSCDGMTYCSWCSLRICRNCGARLRRDWGGDIRKGWGVVESTQHSSHEGVSGPIYVAQWGVATNLQTGDSWGQKNGTKSTLDRVSHLLGVMGRPAQQSLHVNLGADGGATPEFGYDRKASDNASSRSTISPPSPLTPTAPNLPLALSDNKTSDLDFPQFTFDEQPVPPSPPIHTDSPEIGHHQPSYYSSYHHTGVLQQNMKSPPPLYAPPPPPSQPNYDHSVNLQKVTSAASTIIAYEVAGSQNNSNTVTAKHNLTAASSLKQKKGMKSIRNMFSKK